MIEKDIYEIVDESINKIKWLDNEQGLAESEIEDLVYDLKGNFEDKIGMIDFDLFFDSVLFDVIKKYLMKKFKVKE